MFDDIMVINKNCLLNTLARWEEMKQGTILINEAGGNINEHGEYAKINIQLGPYLRFEKTLSTLRLLLSFS